jgi:23S rRNA pseudouridine955/2504/2580 synthase
MTQRSSHRRPKSEIGTVSPAEDTYIRSLLIHEDADILVFNKPPGLSVQGGSGITLDLDRLLWAFATRKGRRPKLVHRLDRETSGVLVVAKTSPAAAHLSAQFAARTAQKTYIALVCGSPTDVSGTIEKPLVRIKSGGLDLMRPAKSGEPLALAASTYWRVLSANAAATLMEAQPFSGRMHQIRVHLAELGYPIAGDDKYGGLMTLGTSLVPRLMLHAQKLELIHPANGEPITFSAALPDDFETLAKNLGLNLDQPN